MHEVIYKTLAARLRQRIRSREDPEARREAAVPTDRTAELLSDVLLVDQSPIGRTPRSNPVTYIKAFDLIRERSRATRKRTGAATRPDISPSIFPGGRCETCQGDGTVTVEMQFLADVELVCEECKGTRYKSSILEVRYKG